jgi:ankyrin repeat protein
MKKAIRNLQGDIKKTREQLHLLLNTATAGSSSRIELALEAQGIITGQQNKESRQYLLQILELVNKLHESNMKSISQGYSGEAETEQREALDTSSGTGPESLLSFKRTQSPTSSTVEFSAKATFSRCKLTCDCACHHQKRFSTYHFLKHFVGRVFVGYSGLPMFGNACTDSECRRQSPFYLQITYHFPTWFLSRALQMAVLQDLAGDPKFVMTMRRRTPYESPNSIYLLARAGDVDAIRNLFTRREAFPNDMEFDFGETPLVYAINKSQWNVCKFLLQAGADPECESDYGVTALEQATTRILCTRGTERAIPALEELFPGTRYFEWWDFSRIHLIVLGIISSPLEKELLTPQARLCLNACDSRGRTPLHWAVMRGDESMCSTLLLAGANPNTPDSYQYCPLHYASQPPTPRCLELLLDAGANVEVQNYSGRRPLHFAAQDQELPAHAITLIERGASVNGKNKSGATPLAIAATVNGWKVGRYLISVGADVHNRDRYGDTPLLEAVRACSHEFVEMLLENSASGLDENNEGSNILHLAAKYGDVKLCEILESYRYLLGCLDPDVADAQGLRPTDTLRARSGMSEDFEKEFLELLERLDNFATANNSWIYSEVSEGSIDKEFFDALDVLECGNDGVDLPNANPA